MHRHGTRVPADAPADLGDIRRARTATHRLRRPTPAGGDHRSRAKEDGSALTIADGLVQRLLVDALFSRVPFRDVVGEEEEEEEDDDRGDAVNGAGPA